MHRYSMNCFGQLSVPNMYSILKKLDYILNIVSEIYMKLSNKELNIGKDNVYSLKIGNYIKYISRKFSNCPGRK